MKKKTPGKTQRCIFVSKRLVFGFQHGSGRARRQTWAKTSSTTHSNDTARQRQPRKTRKKCAERSARIIRAHRKCALGEIFVERCDTLKANSEVSGNALTVANDRRTCEPA